MPFEASFDIPKIYTVVLEPLAGPGRWGPTPDKEQSGGFRRLLGVGNTGPVSMRRPRCSRERKTHPREGRIDRFTNLLALFYSVLTYAVNIYF